MNRHTEQNKRIEKKLRVSETVKEICQNHISEWEGSRIDIIKQFIAYLEAIKKQNRQRLEDEISKIDTSDRSIEDSLDFLQKLEKQGILVLRQHNHYSFIFDTEKKTASISVSLTQQQYEEIEDLARSYQLTFSEFVRQPFYFYERHKKFPWE